MRISDWSSDVCSSDLCGEAVTFDAHSRIKAEFLWDPWKFTTQEAMIDDADKAVELVRREILRCVAARLTPDVDRKSVVKGKSVSVRVDLGGRCIIKTKIQQRSNISHSMQITYK